MREICRIIWTPEHDEIKKRKCEKYAELFGTPEHDEIKKSENVKTCRKLKPERKEIYQKMHDEIIFKGKCEKRAELFEILFTTPEHDEINKKREIFRIIWDMNEK